MSTLAELRVLVKAKNEKLPKGQKFNAFGKSRVAIEQFLGVASSASATKVKTPKAKAAKESKPKTQSKKFETSKTASAIAVAIAKKTGGDPKEIHETLKKKLQAAIAKKRRQMKKEGQEATPKDLRAAAVLAVRQSVRESLKGKVASEEKSRKTSAKVAPKSKTTPVEIAPNPSKSNAVRQTDAQAKSPEAKAKKSKKISKIANPVFEVSDRQTETGQITSGKSGVDEFFKVGADEVHASLATLSLATIVAGSNKNYVNIDFKVNDGFDAGSVSGKNALKVALGAKSNLFGHISRLNDGVLVSNTPYDRDGYGEQRAKLYQKSGFGEVDKTGTQWAIVQGGKLLPMNREQVMAMAKKR